MNKPYPPPPNICTGCGQPVGASVSVDALNPMRYKRTKRQDAINICPLLTNNASGCEVANENIPLQFRTFKYRLLPTRSQHKRLEEICASQRILYNAALEERIDCYKKTGKGRSYIDQCKAVTELRQDDQYSQIPANLQRWTLKRLDDAYKGFFKRGGFPRFRGKDRWKAFGFNEFSGIRFDGKRVKFKGCPSIKVHVHRPLKGEIKSCVFRRDVKGWYICFQCAVPIEKKHHTGQEIGIDVGLESFATLSDGAQIPNPRIARKASQEFRRRQRALARCKRGSNRRRKVKARLARAHEKIRNTRRTFLHQQSARLVRQYSVIAVEDLKIRNMVKNHHLARSISDAGWGIFMNMIAYKAEEAGTRFVKVDPRNTSQACSGCGQIVRKELKERVHRCDCGTVLDRDVNAARNILSRGVVTPYPANVNHRVMRPDENINLEGISK